MALSALVMRGDAGQGIKSHFQKENIINQDTRTARLELDNHECQLSKLFGISHLSGKPCAPDLQAHHIDYAQYGKELITDLITVCTRCHDILTDAIRRERYTARNAQPERQGDNRITIGPQEGLDDDSKGKLQDYRGSTTVDAQRTTSRLRRRIRPRNERDYVQAEKGGR